MNDRRFASRITLIIIGCVAVALFFVAAEWAQFDFPGSVAAVICLALVIAFSAGAYTRVTLSIYRDDSDVADEKHFDAEEIRGEDIDRFVPENGPSRLSAHQVISYAGCIVSPTSYFTRITEHVESYHRSTLVRSVYTIRLYRDAELSADNDAPSPDHLGYLLPLHLPNKGLLTDGLRVFDGGGGRISTVDSRSQSAFAAACIRFLVSFSSSAALSAYLANDREVERSTAALITSSSPKPEEISDAVAALIALDATPDAADTLQFAADLVGELAVSRPISIAVPESVVRETQWPSTLRFSMERRIVAPVVKAPNAAARPRNGLDGLRLALAVRLNRVYFPVASAYRTDSYHLEIAGPEGTYFAGGQLFEPAPPSNDPAKRLTYRLQEQFRRGQRRSHAYISKMSGAAGAYYGAQFFERAPGSFATATVAGIVSTVLIVVLTLINIGPTAGSASDDTSSIIPALLALPIAIAAFVGLEGSQGRRHPSLLSRSIAFATALLSLVSFVFALTRKTNPMPHTMWLFIMCLSIFVTTVTFVSWIVRLQIEGTLVSRKIRS